MGRDISKIEYVTILASDIPRGKVKNDVPHYGLKEHASVDTENGFVLATELTPASHHDSPYLPLCAAASCHTDQPIRIIYDSVP